MMERRSVLRSVTGATMAPVIPGEQHFILSSLSPSRAQKRLALVLALALLAAFLITDVGLSTIQLGRIGAFIPAYARRWS